MDELLRLVASLGGVASYRSLDAFSVSRSSVAAAVAAGRLQRVRDGWFALPTANADVLRAVRVGGVLTGASSARSFGLWMLADDRLHVRVKKTASRLSAPHSRTVKLDSTKHKVCVHYSARALTGCADTVMNAIIEMFSCGDGRAGLVVLDSALNKRLLSEEDLAEMRRHIPLGKRWVFDQADAGAQSGLETLVRLLLTTTRIRHRSQVSIDGAGRVDILIGDRLVLELDGRSFHTGDAFDEDRRRDFALIMQGYLVLRLSYRMVMEQWEKIAAGILHLVRHGEHRWRRTPESGPIAFSYAG